MELVHLEMTKRSGRKPNVRKQNIPMLMTKWTQNGDTTKSEKEHTQKANKVYQKISYLLKTSFKEPKVKGILMGIERASDKEEIKVKLLSQAHENEI